MAILFAASEPQSFDSIGSVSSTASSVYIDSDYTRVGLLVNQANARYVGTLTAPYTITASGSEEIWLHCAGSANSNGSTNSFPVIYLRDTSGQVTGLSNTTPGYRAVVQGNLLGAGFTRLSVLAQFDIQINASGVSYYVDGLLQETVNVNLDGLVFETVEIGRGSSTWGCSEVVVSDQSTIGLRVGTSVPTSQGPDDEMTGTFEDIDETNSDDADFISSATIGQSESFGTTTLRPEGTQLVPIAVTATFRGRQGTLSGGPTNFDGFVTIGGTRFIIGSVDVPPNFGASAMLVANQNPSTSASWGAEANDITFGVTSKA